MHLRIALAAMMTVAVSLGCASCVAATGSQPSSEPSGSESPASDTESPTAEPEPATALVTLDFEGGSRLDPAASVGWRISFGSDADWAPDSEAPEDEVQFVHANGSCTARYIQEVIETSATDDAAASDEFLAELTGDTVESNAPYVADGHFALTGPEEDPGATVATRTILLGDGDSTWLIAVRVFTALDPSIHGMSNAYTLELNCVSGIDPESVVESLDEVAAITVSQ